VNPRGHQLIEPGALLYGPDVEEVLCAPLNGRSANATQERPNSFQVLVRRLRKLEVGRILCW
jgi:hypothetical protein